jgi:hypothetical protein
MVFLINGFVLVSVRVLLLCSVTGPEEIRERRWTACESSEILQSAAVSGFEAVKEG